MNKSILLVASEHDVLESFPVTLRHAGHNVLLARGGLQGIKQARDLAPDLIVLDSALPDMDGETVRGILNRLPSTAHIPTLLLRPRAHKLMPLSLQACGARCGLMQPLNPGQLLRQVGTTLEMVRDLERQAPPEPLEEAGARF
jgi:two-component system alkaline phosphatase synthesis response regulator PhoP